MTKYTDHLKLKQLPQANRWARYRTRLALFAKMECRPPGTYERGTWNDLPGGISFWVGPDDLPTSIMCSAEATRAEVEKALGLAFGAKLKLHWNAMEVVGDVAVVPCEMA